MEKTRLTTAEITDAMMWVAMSQKQVSEHGDFLPEAVRRLGLSHHHINDVDYDVIKLMDELSDDIRKKTAELLIHTMSIVSHHFNCVVVDHVGDEFDADHVAAGLECIAEAVVSMKRGEAPLR